MSLMQDLLNSPMGIGRVEWIGISPGRRESIVAIESVQVQEKTGIDGDHHAGSGRGKRQVTLIQAEHLPAIAAFLGREAIEPELLRRNIVVSGLNLLVLKERTFRIGTAVLKGSGPCAPCSRMEETLRPGGYAAMRGHGGITATVEQGGQIRTGDAVQTLDVDSSGAD
ncbi:MOSC domain-containing protein [Rubinisphaera margarita]|uniref:MOSC domain-containing protein n=1 Tax=Rubinisphaera margarita TaxID=2909586 RepID=UPI001EE94356|nr:MOSC domain-containing protein [Rubinisphaera margarita]MCG6155412.1 MOSC domain-containing protein [Rubinisphaera margarita]